MMYHALMVNNKPLLKNETIVLRAEGVDKDAFRTAACCGNVSLSDWVIEACRQRLSREKLEREKDKCAP
jgi:uncharacterized protein (DUF1778 family)